MKLSLNFVKDYIDLPKDLTVKQIAEDMTNHSSEYETAGKLINATNLIIGEVVECEPHPDSDHLHVCKVNIGKEVLNIVCGAPNVRKGLKVIVAQVGAELPEITIKKGMIRGQESNGMLCSMLELGLESKYVDEIDKTGIHELPADAPIGEDPIKYMGLDDEVIDFELTANRGDLLSILGMAYELGAIYDKKVKDIDLSHKENNEDINDTFKVVVNTENCSLFTTKKVKNVTIKESPCFIKSRLIASGIRPINNVVDISNYVMLETGQPLHFYDADKLNGMLEVRMAENGEKLTTLDGESRTLHDENIVISNGKEAIGLAGVMGGLDTEITENTKNIIIESAIFDGVKVRKTSNELVRSEASNRFEKGLDPNRTYMAADRACALLEKYADAEVVGGIAKYDTTNKEDTKIEVKFNEINQVLGLNIPNNEILNIFTKLGFTYEETKDGAIVSVPKRRIDISIKEDLNEEVGRIYGVNNICGILPALPMKQGSYNRTTREIRNKMIGLGLNETLSYVLVGENEAKQFVKDENESIKLLDPMSEDRNTLRNSMLPSLLNIYKYNEARNQKDVSIFEIAKTFYKKGEEFFEEQHLGVLMAGEYYQGIGTAKEADFFVIKGLAEEILDYLGYKNRYSFVVDSSKIADEFHPGQSAVISVNNDIIGSIGKVHPSLAENVYVLEINLDKLLAKKVGKMKYKEISKFPTVNKDLSIVIDKNITSQEIEKQIKKYAGSTLNEVKPFDIYSGKGIEDGKISITYNLVFGDNNRTLNDEEINETMQKVIEGLEKSLGAEIRK
ncbi:MAG: phenylalanine--tRNA ligase subunit beta [Clostridia bacterium]|nr:phenylalanine--tRNA ligase subunit beta [Clostridia bacterium]